MDNLLSHCRKMSNPKPDRTKQIPTSSRKPLRLHKFSHYRKMSNPKPDRTEQISHLLQEAFLGYTNFLTTGR